MLRKYLRSRPKHLGVEWVGLYVADGIADGDKKRSNNELEETDSGHRPTPGKLPRAP
jgi:hypothetical protein